jgi:hypothetical protein
MRGAAAAKEAERRGTSTPKPAETPIGPVTVTLQLWRRKWWLIPVLVVAVGAGLLVADQRYSVELTSAEVLVDTPSSQTVDLGTTGRDAPAVSDFDTLATRARLLGSLMSGGSLKEAIADGAGLRPDQLVVVPPAGPPDSEPTSVGPGLSKVPDSDAVILTLSTDGVLPILRITAQAPDRALAEELSRTSVRELERYVGTVAAAEEVPEARRLVVQPIGGPRVATETRGPSVPLALLAALAVFAAGCAALLAVSRVRGTTGDEGAEPLPDRETPAPGWAVHSSHRRANGGGAPDRDGPPGARSRSR